MIAFRVELWCNGDGCKERRALVHDDEKQIPWLALKLQEDAGRQGWTIDGAAHWCPRCTRVRTANGNGKLGSAV